MRWLVLIVLVFISSLAMCNSRDSTRHVQRQKAKIERQRLRMIKRWDERSTAQRRTDRNMILFLAIGAGLLVSTMGHKE